MTDSGAEAFVRAYFDAAGHGLHEDGAGILRGEPPDAIRSAFGGIDSIRLTFDPAIAAVTPQVELAVPGSYLLDRLIEDTVRRGWHSTGRISASHNPPETIIGKAVRPKNAKLEVVEIRTEAVPHVLFNFRVRMTTDERIDRVESILIDTRSGHSRRIGPRVFLGDLPIPPEPISTLREIGAHYRSACRALEAVIEPDLRSFKDRAESLLREETERIRGYFDRSGPELLESKAESAADEIRALEFERGRRLEETKEKYRLAAEAELCNVRTILLDVIQASVVLSNRGAQHAVPFEYDSLTSVVDPLPCDVCGKPTPEPFLCFGGHVSGAECVRVCTFCDRVHCRKCVIADAAIVACASCGRAICPDHTEVDALGRKVYCPDHIHSCAICGRTVGPVYVRECRVCEQAYCAVCVSSPAERCATCRAVSYRGADDKAVATIRSADPVLSRVTNWRLGTNRRYTIAVGKGLVWSHLVVLDTTGAVVVRKKVLGI